MVVGTSAGIKPTQAEPVNTEPVDNEPVDNEPVDNEPVDNESADNDPTGSEPVNTQPAISESARSVPARTESAEVTSIRSKSARRKSVQTAPPQSPPPQSRPDRSHRLVLIAALILAVLAAGAAATGLALRGDGDSYRPGALGDTTGAAMPSGSGGSSGGFSPVNCSSPAPAGLPRTPVAGAAKQRNGWALYPGWSYFSNAGFHIAVPDGWTYQTIGTTICFRDPSNLRILSIDPDRSPQGNPVKACRKEVSRLRAAGDLKNYTELRIDQVPGLARAADWEYTYEGRDGERLHAMTRWLAADDGKAYAIGLMTLDLDWPGNFEKWGMIQSTFFTDS